MTNHQIPISKQFPISKYQILKLIIGHWSLIIIWLLFLGYWSFPAIAQPKGLTINADKVSFEKDKNRIEAEGSVEVVYQDVLLHGNHLIYNTSDETIFADRGFKLDYEGLSIEGETLDYLVRQKGGQASKINLLYQGVQLGGEKVSLDVDKLELRNARFTTCDLPNPHYQVTAADVIFYPKYGWLVAYWGFFWLGKFPLVPMPTYIYDFRAEEKAHKNLPPFPEIGSNDEDGSYINERLAWQLRREFSGTYSLSYAANKGIGGGIEADYIVDNRNEGNLRLYSNYKDGFFGGLTHTFSFGGEIESPEKIPFSFFALPRYRRYQLETILSSRERINYQRVSFYPNFSLRSRSGEIIRKEAKYDLELVAGMVAEETNIKLFRSGGNIKFYGDFPETSIGYITPSLGIYSLFYSNGGKWVKTSAGVDLTKSFSPDLSLGLGYLHYFSLEGQSPFNFEMYRFRGGDRLLSSFLFKVGETGAKISTSYFLDNWSPEDIDYSLFFKLHCYNLAVTYRSLRKEFTLGFSLASRV